MNTHAQRAAARITTTHLFTMSLLGASLSLGGCALTPEDELGSNTLDDSAEAGVPGASDDLVGPAGGHEQLPGFDLLIAQAGDDITLQWPDQGAGFVYDVWRSTDPYFLPGDPGSVQLASDHADATYTDLGGNDATSYYYRIETDGADEYLSSISGKFVQPIVPGGYTMLGFPLLDTGALDAASLAAQIPGTLEVKRFTPHTIYYTPGHPDAAWSEDFSWSPGDAVIVATDASAGSTYTQTGSVPVASDYRRTLEVGMNIVTVPLAVVATDSLGLGDHDANIYQLDAWNAGTQQFDKFFTPDGWGTNFAVEPGQALWVYVDEPTPWPLATPFFSEYAEGSLFNKAVEIYNPTDADVDLDDCSVRIYRGGNPAIGNIMPLTGILPPGEVVVLCNDDITDLSPCDIVNGQNFWNGDDTVVLTCGGVPFDAIGEIGYDPGAQWSNDGVGTLEQTLRRSCDVTTGDPEGTDPFDPASEWSAFGQDNFSDFGQFSCP